MLGARVALALGYRFDHVAYSSPSRQFDVIVEAVSIAVTAGAVWLVLWLSTLLRAITNRKLRAT